MDLRLGGHVAISVVADFVVELTRHVQQLFAVFVYHELIQAFEYQSHLVLRVRVLCGSWLQTQVYDTDQDCGVAASFQQWCFHFLAITASGLFSSLIKQSH